MPKPLTDDAAQRIAIEALSAIANDEDQLSRFMATTGLDPDSLRDAAKDQTFLRGVLEYAVQDDQIVLAVAEAAGVAPEQVMQAAHRLGAVWERDTP